MTSITCYNQSAVRFVILNRSCPCFPGKSRLIWGNSRQAQYCTSICAYTYARARACVYAPSKLPFPRKLHRNAGPMKKATGALASVLSATLAAQDRHFRDPAQFWPACHVPSPPPSTTLVCFAPRLRVFANPVPQGPSIICDPGRVHLLSCQLRRGSNLSSGPRSAPTRCLRLFRIARDHRLAAEILNFLPALEMGRRAESPASAKDRERIWGWGGKRMFRGSCDASWRS